MPFDVIEVDCEQISFLVNPFLSVESANYATSSRVLTSLD